MLTQYGGFPAFDLMYDTGGHLVDPAAEAEALAFLTNPQKNTDIAVMSHGWNNDIDEARQLYANFFSNVRSLNAEENGIFGDARQLAILAILWPSKKFADSDLIPGGAAGLNTPDAKINGQLDALQELYAADPTSAAKIQHAREQVAKLEVSQSAQDDFVFILKSLLPPPRGERDEGLDDAREHLESVSAPGHVVLARLALPVFPVLPTIGGGGAAAVPGATMTHTGQAASLFGDISSGIKSGASRLLNLFTYYTMKDRAGIVGRTGVAQTIAKVQALRTSPESKVRIHLIGHSFGGRLVTSAANAMSEPLQSMLLLQAAYSHNGLGKDWDNAGHDGAFRAVVANRKISGPIVITHSVHDLAVGVAYPLASRLMNQAAARFGDANDKFGGIGRNGAQHTPESFQGTLLGVKQTYPQPPEGKFVRNLNGDGGAGQPTISSHSDVAKPEIAWAWLKAIA
jgi:hypothetical protein